MQKVALIIRHVTIGLAIAVAVVLIIDMFINNAMCLTDRCGVHDKIDTFYNIGSFLTIKNLHAHML